MVPLVANAPTEPALPGEFTTKPAVPAGFDRGFRRGVPVSRSRVRFTVESCRSLAPLGRAGNRPVEASKAAIRNRRFTST